MRPILSLLAALGAHFVYGLGLAYVLGELGVLEVMGVQASSVVGAYFAIGVLGVIVSWAMADDVAMWSVGAQPDAAHDELLRELAGRLGLRKAPTLATYRSADVTAFAVSRWPARSRVIVSTGATETLAPAELEALLAHALAKLASHDALTLLLLSGIANPFTLLPARMLSTLLGTCLRTAEEETPSDGVENMTRAACAVVLTPLSGLIAWACGRGAEARAKRRAAAVIGWERAAELGARVAGGKRRTITREMFLAPLACPRGRRVA